MLELTQSAASSVISMTDLFLDVIDVIEVPLFEEGLLGRHCLLVPANI